MGAIVPYLVMFSLLAVVCGFFTWLKGVVRRRGLAGTALMGALAGYEEAMRVTSHDSHHEVRAQVERQAPMSFPGDPRWTSRCAMDGGTRRSRPIRRRRAGRLRRWFRR